MTARRPVKRLEPTTAAYVAGLIDGEGTVTLSREHRGRRRSIVVSISNTDLSLLRFVLSAVGAGCISSKRTYSVRHTPSFSYKIANRQALELLAQVTKHLKTYRAARAALALRHYLAVTPRNGKYSATVLRVREEFERDFLALTPASDRRTSEELS